MLDPGIKSEEGYFVYDSGSEKDIWIQTADGKPFIGTITLNTFTRKKKKGVGSVNNISLFEQ